MHTLGKPRFLQTINISPEARGNTYLQTGYFPLKFQDSVEVSTGFGSVGIFYDPPSFEDSAHHYFGFYNGTMIESLNKVEGIPEEISHSFGFNAGTLNVLLQSYEYYPVEDVAVSFGFLAGSLNTILVTNDIPLEEMSVSFGFNNGDLT